MIGHRKCYVCDVIGHKAEMEKHHVIVMVSPSEVWFHPTCLDLYMARIYCQKRCNCGRHWVSLTEKERKARDKKKVKK